MSRSARAGFSSATLPLAALALAGATACRPPGAGESAARLYVAECARCHAEDGSGLPARRGLEPRLDLTRSSMVAQRESSLLFQRIAYGYGTMPGFAHKLSRHDLEEVVAYVERFPTVPPER